MKPDEKSKRILSDEELDLVTGGTDKAASDLLRLEYKPETVPAYEEKRKPLMQSAPKLWIDNDGD